MKNPAYAHPLILAGFIGIPNAKAQRFGYEKFHTVSTGESNMNRGTFSLRPVIDEMAACEKQHRERIMKL